MKNTMMGWEQANGQTDVQDGKTTTFDATYNTNSMLVIEFFS